MKTISIRQFNREVTTLTEPVTLTVRTVAGEIRLLGVFTPSTTAADWTAIDQDITKTLGGTPPAQERFGFARPAPKTRTKK